MKYRAKVRTKSQSENTGFTDGLQIENPFAIDESVFKCYGKDLYATATLFVPPGKKYAYQNTAGWNKFPNIVEAELIGYEFEYNGIRFKIGNNNTVAVTRGSTKYSGNIVIPESVYYNGITYSVTSIKTEAFDSCYDLISVIIPNSVKIIGASAFEACI